MNAVVADDFSGSAELGGIALRFGFTVQLSTTCLANCNSDFIVIDSDTRSAPLNTAIFRIAEIVQLLNKLQPELVYKKIDSVLRGHLIPELTEMMKGLDKELALVVPCNPSVDRIIKDGIYYLSEIPLHKTEFARDPDFPAKSSKVLDMIGSTKDIPVQLRTINQGITKNGIVVGESASFDDLLYWANHDMRNILPAGGSDFFNALLQSKGLTKNIAKDNWFPDMNRNFLCVCGSNSPNRDVTIKILKEREFRFGEIPISLLNGPELDDSLINNWTDDLLQKYTKHNRLVIVFNHSILPKENLAPKLIKLMSIIVDKIISKIPVNELFIEGGSTASAIVRQIGWDTFFPIKELAPGIVRMRIENVPDIHLTVKPGSYKWPDYFRA